MKLYILARKDAKIGVVMAHIGHVCCSVMINLSPFYLKEWYYSDQTKIILEVENEEELRKYYDKFLFELNYQLVDMIQDVHTQEFYCMSVGPITDERAEALGLKKMKLFK